MTLRFFYWSHSKSDPDLDGSIRGGINFRWKGKRSKPFEQWVDFVFSNNQDLCNEFSSRVVLLGMQLAIFYIFPRYFPRKFHPARIHCNYWLPDGCMPSPIPPISPYKGSHACPAFLTDGGRNMTLRFLNRIFPVVWFFILCQPREQKNTLYEVHISAPAT